MPLTLPQNRRYDLDWLRVFATYTLFLFHVSKVFDPAPFYHIHDLDNSIVMLILCRFIGLWHMPLFFLLAGWSLFVSLRRRSLTQFLRERVSKLLVPLLIGCLLFCPVIKYLELLNGQDLRHTGFWVSVAQQESFRAVIPDGLPLFEPFKQSFLGFLPQFFTQLDRFTWSHLWFLAYLFTFTLLYLPLFCGLIQRVKPLTQAKAYWLYLPIIPLALIQIGLRSRWPGIQNLYNDWGNFAYYSTFLILGFILAQHPVLEQKITQIWQQALALGTAVVLVLLVVLLTRVDMPILVGIGAPTATWSLLLALLGAARRYLQTPRGGLSYLARSAYPVYLLHQIVIVVLAYGVVQLPLGLMAKWILLMLSSITLTLMIYEIVMKYLPWAYFIFAIKPRRPRSKSKPL